MRHSFVPQERTVAAVTQREGKRRSLPGAGRQIVRLGALSATHLRALTLVGSLIRALLARALPRLRRLLLRLLLLFVLRLRPWRREREREAAATEGAVGGPAGSRRAEAIGHLRRS